MDARVSTVDFSSSFTAPPVVLVVDDSADTRDRLCVGMTSAGYTVLITENSNEALKYLEFVVPDAILIDATSPDTGGFELSRWIKASSVWAEIPVLFMVELANNEQIIRCFENGGTDYLSKPLRIPEVLARLTTRIAVRIEARDAVMRAGCH